MATVVSQHVRYLGRHIRFLKNFLEISRKHVFTAPNTDIIKNRVEKKKLKQTLAKSYSFRFQTLICITNFA